MAWRHLSRSHLALEGAVEELSALLDSKRSVESGGSADVNGLAIGDTAATKRVLVEKVALFPRELNAAASLLEKERVLSKNFSAREKHIESSKSDRQRVHAAGKTDVILGQTPDELSGHVSHSWIFGSA